MSYIKTFAILATGMARKARIILKHLPSLPPEWQEWHELY
jgi:hypothetical protein